MSVRLVAVTCAADFQKVKALYREAIPAHERLPAGFLYKKRLKEGVGFYSIYDGEEWVGFVYMLSGEDLAYIYYFAIDETFRSKGYGSAALASVKALYAGKRIILAIDAVKESTPDFEKRQKRKAFYDRNGFVASGYISGKKTAPLMELLVHGGPINMEDMKRLNRLIGKYIGGLLGPVVTWLQNRVIKEV